MDKIVSNSDKYMKKIKQRLGVMSQEMAINRYLIKAALRRKYMS